jgi:hypothetical protein
MRWASQRWDPEVEQGRKPRGDGPRVQRVVRAAACADQRPLKLGEPAEDGQHELAVGCRGVGPGVLDRAEDGTGLSDGLKDVEQVPRGVHQAVQAGDDEHVTWLKLDDLAQLGAIPPGA